MDKRIKMLTRAVCRIYGGVEGYKAVRKTYRNVCGRISRLCQNPETEKIKESNGFGTTLWLLGVHRGEWPRFIEAVAMDDFLYQNCSQSNKEKGLIVAFRAPIDFDSDLEHTALYVPDENTNVTHMIHQEDYRRPFVITTLEEFAKRNKNLRPEFYKLEDLKFAL